MTADALHCAFCKSKLAYSDHLAGSAFAFEARGNRREKVELASCYVCTRNILERVWEMRRALDFTERRVKRGTHEDSRPEHH